MAIRSYAELVDQLTRLIDGEEISATTVTPKTLAQIISLGERRIYREVRSRWNEKAFTSVNVASNLAPIPTDWEATSTMHFGAAPLLPVAEEFVMEYGAGSGDPKYFAEAGANFTFAPAVPNGAVVQGRYFYRWPDLSVTTAPTNALLLAEPDLFVYACLSQSAPFYGQDERVGMWEARYTQIRDMLNQAKNRSAYSAGRIQKRPSALGLRVQGFGRASLGASTTGALTLDGSALTLDSLTLGLA